MEQPNPTFAKIPILDTGKFKQWKFKIQQYLQNEHYALWEVIEFGDSYEAHKDVSDTGSASEGSAKKKGRTVAVTTEDMQKRKNDRNRSDLDTMSLDDLYNHLKVYEPEVQNKSESNSQNMAFISSAKNSSRKEEVNTASFSTASTQFPLLDINQIDEDDIKKMDIKWNMDLLSMRADRFWKKTGKKITIQGTDVAGFDKLKVECFNCHTMGYFARECRVPRSQDRGRRENFKYAPKALMAIDRVGWDWSYMANEEEDHALVDDQEAPTEFTLMAKSSSENKVFDNSLCSKACKKNTYSLNTKITDLSEKLSDSKTMLYHYKLGLSQVEARLIEFKNQEIKFCKKIRGLEFKVESKDNRIERLSKELEELKKEKEGLDSKLIDDTITDYSRPSPSIESNSNDLHSNDSPTEIKTNKDETVRKSFVKYAKMYRKTLKSSNGNSQNVTDDKGYWDSGCSRHMTECIVLGRDFKLKDDTNVLLRTPRQHNMYYIDLNNIVPHKDLTCLVAKASTDESVLWHMRLGDLNFKTMNKLVRHNLNGVAERRNRTLIEAAKTMLAVAKLPVTFWAEAVNTAYNLVKFDAKGDEGYFIGYSMSSKAFRVFNKRTKRVEENLHVYFLENKLIEKGASLNWLFDIDTLTNSMNYVLVVVAGTTSTNFLGTKDAASQDVKKDVSSLRYIALPNWFHEAHLESSTSTAHDACNVDAPESSGNFNPTATLTNPSADHMETLTDPEFPARVYKVEKAMGTIDQTLFIRKHKGDFIIVQVYVDDIIFGSSNPMLCREFKALMHEKFQMSAMGDILKKFRYSDVRSANTSMHKENPWGKDRTGKETIVATSTTKSKYVAAASGCGQVLWIQNQLLDYGLIFCDYHNMIAILEKCKHNVDFYQIVDFVEASHISYALTINPTVYVSHIRQFWSTARIETMNEGTKILAIVDGKPRTIFESSIRRNLKLNDEAEISSLPDAELFKNLALMGTSFSGKTVPLFDSMLVHQGEGSVTPTEPHHTPSPEAQQSSLTAPSSLSLPPATTKTIPTVIPTDIPTLRQYSRRARIAQSSALPTAADEPVSPLGDDSQGEVFPTVFGLEAKQDRESIIKTSALPHDSPPRVTFLAADEGSMQHKLYELTDLCTRLQRQQTEMAFKIAAQDLEITSLKARIKLLEDKDGGCVEPSGEDATIKGRSLEIGEEAGVEKSIERGTAEVATVSVPTGSGLVPTASPIFTTASMVTPYSRCKGKEKMVESDTPKKKKLQEQIDVQMAREMEEKLARED
nr:hypothetical protein [Tanacetum cinerariifolium]